MIKEITGLSGGAQIKVLTDKEKERDMYETAVSINGTLQQKLEAVSIIAERVATFKYNSKVRSTNPFIVFKGKRIGTCVFT